LVGIPDDIFKEVITLQFTARPDNYLAQKVVLANALRVFPFFDPVFIDESKRNDPDAALEARAEVWHIDRVTGLLTSSNIIAGEDGVEEFLESDVMYDGVGVKITGTPARAVNVVGSVTWTQRDNGEVVVFQNRVFEVPTAALFDAWPKAGSGLGGG